MFIDSSEAFRVVSDGWVEIVNPGGLPAGLEKKDFGKISVRRNERIADLFFRMDKVELAGTGLRRMREAMSAAELPPPKIRQTTFFNISFKRPMGQDAENAAPTTESSKSRGVGIAEKGVEKGVENLSAIEIAIYTLIENNPSISKDSMAKTGNLTKKTVEYNLEKLKAKGFIKRIGPDRGGHWEVVDG